MFFVVKMNNEHSNTVVSLIYLMLTQRSYERTSDKDSNTYSIYICTRYIKYHIYSNRSIFYKKNKNKLN